MRCKCGRLQSSRKEHLSDNIGERSKIRGQHIEMRLGATLVHQCTIKSQLTQLKRIYGDSVRFVSVIIINIGGIQENVQPSHYRIPTMIYKVSYRTILKIFYILMDSGDVPIFIGKWYHKKSLQHIFIDGAQNIYVQIFNSY